MPQVVTCISRRFAREGSSRVRFRYGKIYIAHASLKEKPLCKVEARSRTHVPLSLPLGISWLVARVGSRPFPSRERRALSELKWKTCVRLGREKTFGILFENLSRGTLTLKISRRSEAQVVQWSIGDRYTLDAAILLLITNNIIWLGAGPACDSSFDHVQQGDAIFLLIRVFVYWSTSIIIPHKSTYRLYIYMIFIEFKCCYAYLIPNNGINFISDWYCKNYYIELNLLNRDTWNKLEILVPQKKNW